MHVVPTIEHIRDVLWDDEGGVAEIYNHLIYRFEASGIIARAYLDDPDKVSIMEVGPVPDPVLDYLKDRFWRIDQIGAQGYRTIWTA
ncbi:hypothetical protein U1872_13350 [Sphingomonas sp. RB3P16]|uniref:hypothetical protein n=1 Tax=Parasphingomonas frigoris TaxID=3096163 RepID=UPI002FCB5E81